MALASTFLRTIAPRRIVIATLALAASVAVVPAQAAEPATPAAPAAAAAPAPAAVPGALLNASYDVSRELYKEINPAFTADYKAKSGQTIEVNQSHGGSTKQANAVANGLEADVATFNQAPDIDVLVKAGVVRRVARAL